MKIYLLLRELISFLVFFEALLEFADSLGALEEDKLTLVVEQEFVGLVFVVALRGRKEAMFLAVLDCINIYLFLVAADIVPENAVIRLFRRQKSVTSLK